jgi:hypothetical protein
MKALLIGGPFDGKTVEIETTRIPKWIKVAVWFEYDQIRSTPTTVVAKYYHKSNGASDLMNYVYHK